MTTLGGTAGIGLGRLLGREHASTHHSGLEAPRLLKQNLTRLYYSCCCCVVVVLLLSCFVLLNGYNSSKRRIIVRGADLRNFPSFFRR